MLKFMLATMLLIGLPAASHAQDAKVARAAKPSAYAGAGDMSASMAARRKAKTPDDVLPAGPKAFVGAWTIGKDGEGAKVCTIQFNAAGVIGGFQLVAPKTCKGAVDRWDDLYAWRIVDGDAIVLADPTRRSVHVFHKLDSDGWATEGADWERLLLQRAPKARVGKGR